MPMTKKHFIAFASYIRRIGESGTLPFTDRQELADMIIAIASEDNPRFDRARFLKACGL